MGPGSNRTVDNIIKESVLLEVFRNSHLTLEKNLVLNHLTTHHTDPDMAETFAALHRHMSAESALPHEYRAGRKSRYKIPDFIDKGVTTLIKGDVTGSAQEGTEDEDIDIIPGIEDVSVDLIM